MDTSFQPNNSQTSMKFIQKKDSSQLSYSSLSNPNLCKNQNNVLNPFRSTNEKNSTSADSYSYQNFITNYENAKLLDYLISKNKEIELNEFFKTFCESNEQCNFSIFQRNVDINMNLDEKIKEQITLYEYFQSFIEASAFGVNIPFLDQKRNINYNVFNPTLSSMNLFIHHKRNKINEKYLANNYSLNVIKDDYIKIRFDEINPPYKRNLIGNKIGNIHKILGKKKILLKDIDKEKSYFSILWTPADTHKIKSSFLSVYTFDFKLVGTLIRKIDEYNLFVSFNADIHTNNNKDFKKEYYNNIIKVQNFIKKCNGLSENDNLNINIFSQDYRRFIFNY